MLPWRSKKWKLLFMAQLVISFLLMISAYASAQSSRVVDSAEIQWVICEPNPEVLFLKLGVKIPKPSLREVYYTETKDLDLIKHGLFLRTRITSKKIKTALKMRYTSEATIPWAYMDITSSKCEWDVYGENSHIGCSLFYEASDSNHLISELQTDFLKTEIKFDKFEDLKRWGPVHSTEWQFNDFVVEIVRGPENWQLLELSVRVGREIEEQTKIKIAEWLKSKNVNVCYNQQGQTPQLLKILTDHFAKTSIR